MVLRQQKNIKMNYGKMVVKYLIYKPLVNRLDVGNEIEFMTK